MVSEIEQRQCFSEIFRLPVPPPRHAPVFICNVNGKGSLLIKHRLIFELNFTLTLFCILIISFVWQYPVHRNREQRIITWTNSGRTTQGKMAKYIFSLIKFILIKHTYYLFYTCFKIQLLSIKWMYFWEFNNGLIQLDYMNYNGKPLMNTVIASKIHMCSIS